MPGMGMGTDRDRRGRRRWRSSSGGRWRPPDAGAAGPVRPRVRPNGRRAPRASATPRRSSRPVPSAATALEIRPLPPGARERYVGEWQRVQARFVDDPEGAVARGGHADPVRHGRTAAIRWTTSTSGLPTSPSTIRRSSRTIGEAHRLTRASALGDGDDGGSPAGDAALPGALRRARRGTRGTPPDDRNGGAERAG